MVSRLANVKLFKPSTPHLLISNKLSLSVFIELKKSLVILEKAGKEKDFRACA